MAVMTKQLTALIEEIRVVDERILARANKIVASADKALAAIESDYSEANAIADAVELLESAGYTVTKN